jgi:hypothetical protein
VEAPAIDGSWPGVIATPQEETTRSEPSVGQTKGDMAEVSLEVMVMEQGPMSMLSTPSATRETVRMEVSRREGAAALGSSEELPRALA